MNNPSAKINWSGILATLALLTGLGSLAWSLFTHFYLSIPIPPQSTFIPKEFIKLIPESILPLWQSTAQARPIIAYILLGISGLWITLHAIFGLASFFNLSTKKGNWLTIALLILGLPLGTATPILLVSFTHWHLWPTFIAIGVILLCITFLFDG